MLTFNPSLNLSALNFRLQQNNGLIIACYCAQWCDTCKQYQTDFELLAQNRPEHTFVWIDIEDHPELLGDDDVENFPTLLIQSLRGNLFFGTLLPYISHLEKLLDRIDSETPFMAGGPPLLRPLLAAAAQ
ncbi:MAG TPA: thioredoxin family protein [Eoetvoesiella sp.]